MRFSLPSDSSWQKEARDPDQHSRSHSLRRQPQRFTRRRRPTPKQLPQRLTRIPLDSRSCHGDPLDQRSRADVWSISRCPKGQERKSARDWVSFSTSPPHLVAYGKPPTAVLRGSRSSINKALPPSVI